MSKTHGPHAFPCSEDEILAAIGRHFPLAHPGIMLGRGDDCALLRAERPICVSTDLFLEGVHFRRSYFQPHEIGYKALAVNISDLAASGARPLAFTMGLGLPPWLGMDWLESFLGGMADLAETFQMALAGGDLSQSDSLHISITAFGERPEQCSFLGRGGSMPGDVIFVIGQLGLAHVGLNMLEECGRAALGEWPAATRAHLMPKPQVAAGLMLARAGFNARPPALMDVSDGLLRDLPRLLGLSGELASPGRGFGAELALSNTALHREVLAYSRKRGLDPVHVALAGGEDYSLLGTCAPDMLGALRAAITGLQPIGEVVRGGRIACNGEDISALRGFDHFENAENQA